MRTRMKIHFIIAIATIQVIGILKCAKATDNSNQEIVEEDLETATSNDTSKQWNIQLSNRDSKHIEIFREFLDSDSLTPDGRSWTDPNERVHFYVKILAFLDDITKNGGIEQSKGGFEVLPMDMLKRKLSQVTGTLLRYASEFEKISRDAGLLQTFGGSLGIVGGAVTLIGIALAPFTGGGSLVLTGVSLGMTFAGSGAIILGGLGFVVPGDQIQVSWEEHYVGKVTSKINSTLDYIDTLNGILLESIDAFREMDRMTDGNNDDNHPVLKTAWWFKQVYSTALKSYKFMNLPNKLEAIKDIVRTGKKVSSSINQSKKIIEVGLNILDEMDSGWKTIKDIEKVLLHVGVPITKNSNDALNIAASGIAIPWVKHGKFASKVLIQAGTKMAVFLSVAGSALSIGGGIWQVLVGAQNIKGSGILSDRIRNCVYSLDQLTSQTFEIYDILLHKENHSKIWVQRPKVLSGLEVHTCYQTSAQSDSPISMQIKSGNHTCVTAELETSGHNDLEVNQWDVYTSFDVLGDCQEFIFDNTNDIQVRLKNDGFGAHCFDVINLQVDYLSRPYFTCTSKSGVWSEYGASEWVRCTKAPEVSKIDIYPCLSDYAGTDSDVQMILRSGDSECLTEFLNNNGNDLARGSVSEYRTDILGDKCKDFEVFNDSIEVSFIHHGYDALCLGVVLIHGSSSQHFGKSQLYKCDIPAQDIIEYEESEFYNCKPFEPERERALYAVRPHICDVADAGSSTGFDYGVAFEFCNGNKCCRTNYLDFLYFDELTRGSSDLFNLPGALGECYGFEIDRDGGNVTYTIHNTNSDAVCILGVDIYTMATRELYPYLSCQNPNQRLVWAEEESKGPFPCRSHSNTLVTQIETLVCDESYAGSDSLIRVGICKDEDFMECCSTGDLDKSGQDDFERADFAVYGGPELLRDCSDFKVHPDVAFVSVINTGSDAVCFKQFSLRTMDGSLMSCFIPNEKKYWIENGRLDLQCQKMS